jgi:hypothetical protein
MDDEVGGREEKRREKGIGDRRLSGEGIERRRNRGIATARRMAVTCIRRVIERPVEGVCCITPRR